MTVRFVAMAVIVTMEYSPLMRIARVNCADAAGGRPSTPKLMSDGVKGGIVLLVLGALECAADSAGVATRMGICNNGVVTREVKQPVTIAHSCTDEQCRRHARTE